MPVVLPNKTTTDSYADTVLGGDRVYSGGVLVVANNPVSIIMLHGSDRGAPSQTEYSYVAPTTIPLQRGEREGIIGLQIKSAVAGNPAQVFGYLVEPGVAGLGVGTPFTQTISAAGSVSNGMTLTRGFSSLTFPGGAVGSNTVTINHGLPSGPASVQLTCGGLVGVVLPPTFDFFNITATSFDVRAFTTDGSVPAAGASVSFAWVAIL